MPAQVAVCVQAELVADREQGARDFLEQIRSDVLAADGTVHFARIFVLDRVVDAAGRPIPTSAM